MRVFDIHTTLSRQAGPRSFDRRMLVAAVLMAMSVGVAYAAGTPAGTLIQSRATAMYSVRSAQRTDTSYSQTVIVTVLQKAAVNITPAAAAQSTATMTDYALSVINSGNGSDRFQLSAASANGWTTALYADANGDGMLQADEIAAGTVTQTPPIAADAAYRIIVRVTVPPGQPLNGTIDTTIVRAQSLFAAAVAAQGRYITSLNSVSVNGVLTVNDPSPKPGDDVTFTAVFTNNGSIRAENIALSCLIAGGFTYVSASGGTVSSTANPVTWTVGVLDPGESASVTLTLRVDASAAVGTVLNEQISAAYIAASAARTSMTNTVQVRVASPYRFGVKITPLVTAVAGECTDTIAYRCRVANTGNVKDRIRLTAGSSRNFAWNCYRDANNNARYDAGDPLLAGTGTGAGAIIDSVAAGDSVRIFAVCILPRVPSDQTKDTLHLAVFSDAGTTTDAASMVTTINVPNVVVSKTIFPAGNHAPGSELTYTIAYSNTGHAAVENFSVVDTAPLYTEYIANSVKVDGIAAFDNEGPVRVTTAAGQSTVISVSIGKLSSSKNGSVEFKVKVK